MKTMPGQAIQETHAFTDEARDAVYRAIFSRRDVRGTVFTNTGICIGVALVDGALQHHFAASVGITGLPGF
ncbi:MAG: hypothetical protein Q7U13_12120 [Rhodoferax sp.]|nr:hypothetical protein [Rhodoferax sp.]